MKKLLCLLSILFLTVSAAQANSARVKYGPVQYPSKQGAVVSLVGSNVQVTLGGNTKNGSNVGIFTISIPASQLGELSKGKRFDVISTGDGSQADAVSILFLGTKINVNGRNTTITGISSTNDTTANGNFRVVNYNQNTKQLRFNLVARAKPYSRQVTKGIGGSPQTKVINKNLPVKVQGTVTLP
jgi:hypothetical protein